VVSSYGVAKRTKVHGVDGRDVATEGLHDKRCHFVADIAGGGREAALVMVVMIGAVASVGSNPPVCDLSLSARFSAEVTAKLSYMAGDGEYSCLRLFRGHFMVCFEVATGV